MKITKENPKRAMTFKVELSAAECESFEAEYTNYDAQEDWSIQKYDTLKHVLFELMEAMLK